MSRLARWLFYLAAATCGLATLAVAGLWVRSYKIGEEFIHATARAYVVLISSDGAICLQGIYDPEPRTEFSSFMKLHWARFKGAVSPRWGFGTGNGFESRSRWLDVRCPHWAILLPLLLVDAWLVRRGVVRWRRRRRAGCCAECGYNLTGNVSGVCPECGTPTPAGPAEPRP